MFTTVLELKKGQKARVSGIDGGGSMRVRLENLGIREGKIITRVSSQFMGGPVVVSVDSRQLAMGRGMASRIRVGGI